MLGAGKALVGALLVAAIAGCGGGEATRAAAPPPEAAREPTEQERARYEDRDHDPEKWRGFRWRGKGEECLFLFDNECFATRKAACRAAGCGLSSCQGDGAEVPSRVSCPAAPDDDA